MTKELLAMEVGEKRPFPYDKYDTVQNIKSRLKRLGKGEWQSCLGGMVLTIKRTK